MHRLNKSLKSNRFDKLATLIVFGFGIMFSSTLFQGIVGSSGRVQMLTGGFVLLVIGALGLLQNSLIVKKSNLGITAGIFLVVMGISYVREHSIFEFKSIAFVLIALACVASGQILGALSNIKYVTFSPYLLTLLATFLGGSFAWYSFIDIGSLEVASRISGDEDLHPVGVAYVMSCCIVMTTVIGLFSQGRLPILLALATLPLLALNLLGAGSRGALVAITVTLLFIIHAYVHSDSSRSNRPKLSAKRMAGLCLAAAVPIIAIALTATESIVDQADFLIRRLQSLGDVRGDASASERIYTWSEYASRFEEFWVIGLPNYDGSYPHNLFYEMWLRFGLIGLILALFSLFIAISKIRNCLKANLSPLDVLMISLFIFGFLNGQFNLSLESNRAFWIGLGYISVRRLRRIKNVQISQRALASGSYIS